MGAREEENVNRSFKPSARLAATMTLLACLGLGVSSASAGSYAGGPDRADAAFARYELDPAIRTAIASHSAGAVSVTSSDGGYAGGPDRSEGAFARYELDPAIRTAIAARSSEARVAMPAAEATPAPGDGFAWGAAALGLAFGIAGMCLVLGCVTLVRHDGRLRSA